MEYLNSGFVTILSHYMAYAVYVTLLGKPTSSHMIRSKICDSLGGGVSGYYWIVRNLIDTQPCNQVICVHKPEYSLPEAVNTTDLIQHFTCTMLTRLFFFFFKLKQILGSKLSWHDVSGSLKLASHSSMVDLLDV